MFLTERVVTGELMDDPAADRAELAASLSFLRMVNRRLGGIAAALRPLRRWASAVPAEQTIEVIDIGTGSADIPVAIAEWAEQAGRRVRIVGVDLHETTLELARAHVAGRRGIELVRADATDLMDHFEPSSFDVAHAGMFLHHLSDVQVMTVLRIMDRLTRRGVIWNDLLRSMVGRIGVRLLSVGAPPMVRHDGPASVAAGFTRREALVLAERAGLPEVSIRTRLGYRFTLTSEKKAMGNGQ